MEKKKKRKWPLIFWNIELITVESDPDPAEVNCSILYDIAG